MGRITNSKFTTLQDIRAMEASKRFYESIVSKLKTRGKFFASCYAAVVATTKTISYMYQALSQEADMSVDGGEFSGRFW